LKRKEIPLPYIFKRSIVIHVPPELVFDYLLDIPAHQEWGDMHELEILYEGPLQVGSRWRSAGKTSVYDMHDECTIAALERPSLFSFRSVSQSNMGTGEVLLSYHLETVPEGTHVTFSREVLNTDGLPPVMKAIVAIPGIPQLMDALITKDVADRGLVRLRDKLEQSQA